MYIYFLCNFYNSFLRLGFRYIFVTLFSFSLCIGVQSSFIYMVSKFSFTCMPTWGLTPIPPHPTHTCTFRRPRDHLRARCLLPFHLGCYNFQYLPEITSKQADVSSSFRGWIFATRPSCLFRKTNKYFKSEYRVQILKLPKLQSKISRAVLCVVN